MLLYRRPGFGRRAVRGASRQARAVSWRPSSGCNWPATPRHGRRPRRPHRAQRTCTGVDRAHLGAAVEEGQRRSRDVSRHRSSRSMARFIERGVRDAGGAHPAAENLAGRRRVTGPALAPARRSVTGGAAPGPAIRRGQSRRPIRLRDLAARAGLSPYHFARAFRTSAGMTPRAFVEQRRIERAKHLLTIRRSRWPTSPSTPASARRAG